MAKELDFHLLEFADAKNEISRIYFVTKGFADLSNAKWQGIDPSRSYYVGDKVTDVLPAVELRGRGILVRTGYGREHEASLPAGTAVVDDLRAAADLILLTSPTR
jgi:phosphoglycolate phosphatase-like HAD superfamily hydrolase